MSTDGEDGIILQHGTKRVTLHSIGLYPLIQEFAEGRVFQRGVAEDDLLEGFDAAQIDEVWDTLLGAGIAQYVAGPAPE
jgi:hypothetical protein